MRTGVWVVLVLMGGVPAGALAQQEAREPPAEQARVQKQISNEALQQQLAELWQALHELQGEVAQLRQQERGREQAPAVGGSGRTEGTGKGVAQPGGTSQIGGSGQMGAAPGGTSRMIIIEQPASGQQPASGTAPLACKQIRVSPGTGGSGMGPRSQAPAGQPAEQVFEGRVRSVTSDRLIMTDPSNRVYEFGVGAQTRVIGPEGEASSLQALEQGDLVRAVTRGAGVRNEVRSLQIIGTAPKPSP